MTDYALVLARRWPGAEWTLNGNDPASVVWLSDGDAPSQADMDAVAGEVELEVATERAQAERRSAYLSESDPLFFEWQRGEGTEQAWLAKVAEIKARFPLP